MKQDCSVVRDLLPLYVEGMVREETGTFVKGHLAECPECQAEYEKLREPAALELTAAGEYNDAPLRRVKRKLVAKRVQTALLAGILMAVVLLSTFAVCSTHQYIPYTQDLLEVTELDDGSVSVTFDPRVPHIEAFATPGEQGEVVYRIQAWAYPWEGGEVQREAQFCVISDVDTSQLSIYYVQNNGQADVLIYGEGTDGGTMTLPRLVLGYYLLVAIVVFLVLLVMLLVVRKQSRARRWVVRGLLLPVCYVAGHLIVMGPATLSYTATRDFILIVAIGVLLYCGALLAEGVYRLWREWRTAT